ncbi:phosphatidylinositol 3-kinase catalytic subunit type 3-like [Tropilaelaps mercedesae]|uniref:Phosphatidylinositol 3-kinase catalytic subunit type 3 n=1 Tax=Tropilaelaps mercedesae TaxID=418985 RepID=A0A1V9XA88_9ACAR|nr:phosphatidylinositol 3-kinase catalytic subunit type 3-like [Tropilaelaps mercedesae]
MNLLDGEPTSQLLRYVYSSDLDARFKIKVVNLEGDRPRPPYQDLVQNPLLRRNQLLLTWGDSDRQSLVSDLVVTVEIFSDGRSLALPTQTSYKPFTTRYNWNEWLTLPLKFSDLPRDAQLAFTVWDLHGPKTAVPVGGTTVSVFNKSGAMRQGMHDLKLWANSKADGGSHTSTPGKISGAKDELARLIKLTKKHHNGEMARVDWMDRLTFREIEILNNNEKKKSQQMFLMIEFPRVVYRNIEHMVVYFEKDLDTPCHYNGNSATSAADSKLATMFDPDVWFENLVEEKHHKLSRNQRTQLIDKDLKPNATIRDQLNRIVNKCSTTPLTADEQDLVWKFRFYLKDQKKALAKFVHCVKWNAEEETFHALELMRQWEPMDVEDALELLGPQFKHTAVRRYAVTRLEQASDEDLLLYLLQLVQALKYEPSSQTSQHAESVSSSNTVFASVSSSPNFCGSVHQGGFSASSTHAQQEQPLLSGSGELSESSQSSLSGATFASALDEDARRMEKGFDDQARSEERPPELRDAECRDSRLTIERSISACGEGGALQDKELNSATSLAAATAITAALEDNRDLASFLIKRACRSDILSNYLYWYLTVESEGSHNYGSSAAGSLATSTGGGAGTQAVNNSGRKDNNSGCRSYAEMYADVLRRLVRCLKDGNREQDLRRKMLAKQMSFVTNLVNVMKTVAAESGNRQKKIEKLKVLLNDPEQSKLALSESLALPLNPKIRVKAIVADQATLFKSALTPCRLTFLTDAGKEYVAIFKHGDDLRQDQLILQIISLMDKLLRRENLDLQLTPYCVLATSTRHGFVEYVESRTVADVLKEEGSIQNYFRKCAPCDNGPYGIEPEVMDNYVKSCAGYCVITYLLGVGDRHLDNLLLTKRGQLFHIDFGYILGRDPKPLPPPMKLSREMVEAMGGVSADHYNEFKKQCYTTFLHLRRHANLILNLFSLMVDASVPDIALEPDKTAKKVQDKFMLEMSDEEAVSEMQRLIDASVSAVMAVVVESLHKWAQYWRK